MTTGVPSNQEAAILAVAEALDRGYRVLITFEEKVVNELAIGEIGGVRCVVFKY